MPDLYRVWCPFCGHPYNPDDGVAVAVHSDCELRHAPEIPV